ncbi:hypothetical protein RRF57_004772 [Xylaria bambusicola]|uniref:Uncharacterized protein n=1 Tax=Xylaria bambusicola TaxID=326684 RepID=A0AAN7Z461_9PEZI
MRHGDVSIVITSSTANMDLAKSFSSFVVSTLLATSALGSTIQLPRQRNANSRFYSQAAADAVPREAKVRSKTMSEGIRRRAGQCLSDMKKKRELAARADYNIGIGEASFGKD